MPVRKILVFYGDGYREKHKVELPLTCESDVAYVKQVLLRDLKSSGKIHILGGDSHTSSDQIRLFRYDEVFEEDLDFLDNTVFYQGQKDILAKVVIDVSDFPQDISLSETFIQSFIQYGKPTEATLETSKDMPKESTSPVMVELTEITGSYVVGTNAEAANNQPVSEGPLMKDQDSKLSAQHYPLSAQGSVLRVQVSSLPALSHVMVKARAEGKLVEHLVEFVHLHAAHLLDNMAPNLPSTQESKDYFARYIMEGYPELLHMKDMLKTRFLKCLRNKKDYSKNGPKRKQEKRQASSDENSSVGNQTSANVDNHFNNELSPDFLKRRAILEENKNASLFAIIELVPVYKNIEMIYEDFLRMEPVRDRTIQEIEKKFYKTMDQFRKYLSMNAPSFGKGKKGKSEDVQIDFESCSEVDVLLSINKLCSTLKGVPDVPLIRLAKVGTSVEKNPRHKLPVAVVYFREDMMDTRSRRRNLTLVNFMIHVGEQISFIRNEKPTAFDVCMHLLSMYYCFDLQFPAMYGVIRAVDKYCLSSSIKEPCRKKTKISRSKSERKEAYEEFIQKFEAFADDIV